MIIDRPEFDKEAALRAIAKVIGVNVANCTWIEDSFYSPYSREKIAWNPLTDDGFAFDVMVRFELQLLIDYNHLDGEVFANNEKHEAHLTPDLDDVIILPFKLFKIPEDASIATKKAIIREAIVGAAHWCAVIEEQKYLYNNSNS
jgi:hypothetical protein